MYTIISTLSGMGFANKLSEGLEGSTVLTFEDAIKSPEKLDGCEYLGLVFNNEGVELPADVEDLIFDVLSLNGRLKKIKYMFSICLCMKSVGYALMIVEKLCRKYGHTPELSLSFTTRSKNNVDVNKALYHIRSQNHIIPFHRHLFGLFIPFHPQRSIRSDLFIDALGHTGRFSASSDLDADSAVPTPRQKAGFNKTPL